MKRAVIIVTIGLILIFIGAALLVVGSNIWSSQKMEKQQNEKLMYRWETFENDSFEFTFQYPRQAIVDISDPAIENEPARVRIRLIGPESEPNTEITDGFTFYIRSIMMKQNGNFSEAAQRIYENIVNQSKIVQELQKSQAISGRNSYTFSIKSELGGEHQYTVISGNGDRIFITSETVSVPKSEKRNYRSVLQKMKMSLRTTSHNS